MPEIILSSYTSTRWDELGVYQGQFSVSGLISVCLCRVSGHPTVSICFRPGRHVAADHLTVVQRRVHRWVATPPLPPPPPPQIRKVIS